MELTPEALAWMAKLNTNKDLGPGTVVLASEMVIPKRFPSGSLSLDVILGGGFPGNQWTEIIGPASSGKTAITLKTIAANQAADPAFTTFWLAAEHYDTDQAAALGVDNSRVLVAPTQHMELGLEFLDDALESRAFDALVMDSFPALLPDLEAAKGMDEPTVAVGAKLFNKFWRKAGLSGRRDPFGTERPFVGIIINQWRDKIGTWAPRGTPQTSPGGNGKDYAFYTRLKVTRADFITEKRSGLPDPVPVGQEIVVSTIKNKSAAPQQKAAIEFFFRDAPGKGFARGEYNLGQEYVSMGIVFGVVQLSGTWLHYDGQQWQGRAQMSDAVQADAGLREKLAAEVLEVAADPRRADDISRLVKSPTRKLAAAA